MYAGNSIRLAPVFMRLVATRPYYLCPPHAHIYTHQLFALGILVKNMKFFLNDPFTVLLNTTKSTLMRHIPPHLKYKDRSHILDK